MDIHGEDYNLSSVSLTLW